MKVFEFAGIIFNADNVCTIQKVNIERETADDKTKIPGIQVVTIAGGVNFTFENEKERDGKFTEFLHGLEKL